MPPAAGTSLVMLFLTMLAGGMAASAWPRQVLQHSQPRLLAEQLLLQQMQPPQHRCLRPAAVDARLAVAGAEAEAGEAQLVAVAAAASRQAPLRALRLQAAVQQRQRRQQQWARLRRQWLFASQGMQVLVPRVCCRPASGM